jgi:hypothetical protein
VKGRTIFAHDCVTDGFACTTITTDFQSDWIVVAVALCREAVVCPERGRRDRRALP